MLSIYNGQLNYADYLQFTCLYINICNLEILFKEDLDFVEFEKWRAIRASLGGSSGAFA